MQVVRIEPWIKVGAIEKIDPPPFLMMLWATTQWYADFEHQIDILKGGKKLDHRQFEGAKQTVREIVLRGIGASSQ
ncbi:MAG: TetR family transcriptional regulator [Devosia sp.]|nr:TetR family transcriptional regulator [Devosia sp.]